MRYLKTLLLLLLTGCAIALCVLLATDGNLARLTGWYRFREGLPLFGEERIAELPQVEWMRISDLHDTIECERDAEGTWWITKPFRDRMDQAAAQRIMAFTAQARVVETLPMNKEIRRNMREFGVETTPVNITLKMRQGDHLTTVARYTLGNASPWLEDAGNGYDVLPTTYLRTNFFGNDNRIHVVTGNIQNLFREGLEALRDNHPLHIDPEQLRRIDIETKGATPVRLSRLSSESAWTISSPVLAAADEDKVNGLVRALMNLSAIRVSEQDEVTLDAEPTARITLHSEGSEKDAELVLYPSLADEAANTVICHATVNDRPVVFELPAARTVNNKGSYGAIIRAATELPVLPDKAMAQVRRSLSTVYTDELELTLPELRSLQFADIDTKDISRVALISPALSESLRLIRIPGDAENEVQDVWLYNIPRQGRGAETAETGTVLNFLKALSSVPVQEIVADAHPGEDMYPLLSLYGLNEPRYLIMLQPNPCAIRMTIFGQDMPLVKDRRPRTFAISRAHDPATGKLAWFGTEYGSSSISRLSPKFTRLLSLRAEKWKNRSLADFPLSSVRRLILGYQQAPLMLDYDYIGESWAGTMGGEDVTPRINPHRAEYYIRRLQKLKVSQWLEKDDPDALAALRQPVFSVRLELEITDYSDAEATIIESTDDTIADGSDAADMLSAADEEDQRLRDLALAERTTHAETRTIVIAPSDYDSDRPFFYGRMEETGELFILSYEDAQGLAGDILDM